MTSVDLTARIAAFDEAVISRSVELADDVLDPDYALVVTRPTASVAPRAQWLALLPDYVVHDWSVDMQHVDEDGDLAVVAQQVTMRATVAGVDRSGAFMLTDVWRRADGVWRVWRRHSTHLDADRPATELPTTS